MSRKKKIKSITILGRKWWDKQNGNTYNTAQIMVNGETVGKTPFQYGYGDHYVDPMGVTQRLGTAFDSTYVNDYLPYFTIEGENDGAVFFDNLIITVIPEPTTLSLLLVGTLGLMRRRRR